MDVRTATTVGFHTTPCAPGPTLAVPFPDPSRVTNAASDSGSVAIGPPYEELSVRRPRLARAVSSEARAAFAPLDPVTVGLAMGVVP